MALNNNILKWFSEFKLSQYFTVGIVFLIFSSCSISYKFNGASIDYSKTKTISISDFPNTADLVYQPLSQEFSEKLRDTYAKQTRLQLLKKGGDLNLEGEITGYQLTPMAISADTYASQTKLTLTIMVRFTNVKLPDDDFEKSYSVYRTFDSNVMLTTIQDELLKEIIEEITDNIYNDTVAKW
ncbi:MAG TPA: LptE family protein [Paludibacter sp.]|nr:LptE family protein [Paludibacter sp.]